MRLLWITIVWTLFKYNYGQEETTLNIREVEELFKAPEETTVNIGKIEEIFKVPEQSNLREFNDKCGVRNKNDSILHSFKPDNQSNFGKWNQACIYFISIISFNLIQLNSIVILQIKNNKIKKRKCTQQDSIFIVASFIHK